MAKVQKRYTFKAERKARVLKNKLKKASHKAWLRYQDAKHNREGQENNESHAANNYWKNHYKKIIPKYKKVEKSKHNHWHKVHAKYEAAKSKYNRIVKKRSSDKELAKIANAISTHKKKWHNEGNAAIYPTNGGKGASSVVYISPYQTESATTASTITSYPVDKGAPRSNYARESSRSISLSGLIAGKTRADAKRKFNRLTSWQDNHVELTYKGDIYYPHLLISSLEESYQNFRDNILVSITFTFVYAAKISKSTGKHNHKKASKSSKTVEGNRHKKYIAITVKAGDTLWGLSKRYGKSVKWIAKVNHIKNINRIPVHKKLRVR